MKTTNKNKKKRNNNHKNKQNKCINKSRKTQDTPLIIKRTKKINKHIK